MLVPVTVPVQDRAVPGLLVTDPDQDPDPDMVWVMVTVGVPVAVPSQDQDKDGLVTPDGVHTDPVAVPYPVAVQDPVAVSDPVAVTDSVAVPGLLVPVTDPSMVQVPDMVTSHGGGPGTDTAVQPGADPVPDVPMDDGAAQYGPDQIQDQVPCQDPGQDPGPGPEFHSSLPSSPEMMVSACKPRPTMSSDPVLLLIHSPCSLRLRPRCLMVPFLLRLAMRAAPHETHTVSFAGPLKAESLPSGPSRPSDGRFQGSMHSMVKPVVVNQRSAHSHPQAQLVLITDASLDGWGAVLLPHKAEASGHWNNTESDLRINILELKVVFLALKTFLPSVRNMHFMFRTDNLMVVAYIRKQGGQVATTEWSLHPLVFKQINLLLGDLYIDLFATEPQASGL